MKTPVLTAAADAPRPRPLVAAARSVNLMDRADIKRATKKQPWQTQLMTLTKKVGELGFIQGYAADMASRLVLFPAVEIGDDADTQRIPLSQVARAHLDQPEDISEPLAEAMALVPLQVCIDAIENWRMFRSRYGGQAELQRRGNGNLEGPGEFWIVGRDDEDGRNYEVLSVSEVFVKDERLHERRWRGDNEGVPLDGEDVTAFKVWIPDFEYHQEAYSNMRPLIDDAEVIGILTGQIKAESRSRHVAGLLTWPNELSYGPPDPTSGEGGEEAQADQSLLDLEDAILAPATDADDPGTVMPTVVRGDKEALKEVRLIPLGRQPDALLDERIERRVIRIARGVNFPPEVVLGFRETTFTNSGQIDEDTYEKFFAPRARLLCQAFTYGYFTPAMREIGTDQALLDRLVVWYDPSALIADPDPGEHAGEAHDRLAISDSAYRRIIGLSEDDAPSPAEKVMRMLAKAGTGTAGSDVLMMVIQMMAADADLVLPELPAAPEPMPMAPAGQVVEEPIDAVVVSSARSRPLGERLASIDAQLRNRLLIAASAQMARALERAGNKAKAKAKAEARAVAASCTPEEVCAALGQDALTAAGLSSDELIPDDVFDGLEVQFRSWVEAAGDDGLRLVERTLSGFTRDQRDAAKFRLLGHIDEAWQWFKNALLAAGRSALFGADAGSSAHGEFDPTLRVKPGIVREALARAGGTPLEVLQEVVFVATGGRPAPGVATGEIVLGGFRDAGGMVEAYQWDYGLAPRARPFDPHVQLDGVVFSDFNDPVLAYSGWPDFGYLFPGDHDGCICDAVPILIPPTEVQR